MKWAWLVGAILVFSQVTEGFKESDFKKCKDSGFCNRNRGVSGTKYEVDPSSVATSEHAFSATLWNRQASKPFQLTLTPYKGFVRIHVDEQREIGRYEVSDIIVADLASTGVKWSQKSSTDKKSVFQVDSSQVEVQYQPFQISISVGGALALVLNGRSMFNFEHRRQKEDTGADTGSWEETFNGHKDTQPNGPESISVDLTFSGFEHVYGIPERATSLSLKPTAGESEPYRLYNLDVFEYVHQSPFGLYGSIPMLVAHRLGLTVGAFWLNGAEMQVDLAKQWSGTSVQWMAESGVVDLFLLLGPTPADVNQQYAALTGTTAMPQLFSLGYHQCRWNYKDDADSRAVDAGFDANSIPYDVLWLDIEHTDGKRYLTWDKGLFPEPVLLQEDVASRGREMVTIVDPHVKRDPNYYVFSEAQSNGYYVRNKLGAEFDGWCWPGSSSYLDVTSPDVRSWWAKQFALDKYQGSTKHLYIWNDMNEPSVFNGPEITMHKDNLHWGDVEHRNVHNLYGLYYHMATADGLTERGYTVHPDGDRPFVLSRAFFSGTQRVGPIWTGDNAAQWEHLRVSVPMLLTLGITGLPFSGADVGGFFGNPNTELLTRWYQLGAYYPFFRGHAHLETQRREPWLFGEPTTSRIRVAIRTRYALLPYVYTLFRVANLTGAPVVRPLWYEFPENKETFATDDVLMLGSGMLVAPVMSAGATAVDVLLPRGSRWFDAHTGAEMLKASSWLGVGSDQVYKVQVTMESIPVFYRGGHIVPRRERPRRSTAAMATDPITLVVAADSSGFATGLLYLDDGSSFAFQRGAYLHMNITLAKNKLSSSPHTQAGATPVDGSYSTEVVIERVVFLGLDLRQKWQASVAGSVTGDVSAPLEQGIVNPAAAGTPQGAFILHRAGLKVSGGWSVSLSAV